MPPPFAGMVGSLRTRSYEGWAIGPAASIRMLESPYGTAALVLPLLSIDLFKSTLWYYYCTTLLVRPANRAFLGSIVTLVASMDFVISTGSVSI